MASQNSSYPTAGCRSLHWVLKIGNLKDSIAFFDRVLGLRVLRHEEFSSGCEATCNGPYGGAWSKTMVGYGSEDSNFVLELTYNYGIDSYAFGNDLQYICLHHSSALARAAAFGYEVTGDTIKGPDNYKYKILPPIKGRAEMFVCIGVRVNNLSNAFAYWNGVLGLQSFLVPSELHVQNVLSTMVGFGQSQVGLHLIEVNDGLSVDHAKSSGRIAFACKKVPPIFELVKSNGKDIVQTPPLTLPTPGKADVVVTILVDRDGYEICFVEDEAFYALATPLYDVIDFAERATRGGDGAPPPSVSYETTTDLKSDFIVLEDVEEAQSIISESTNDSKKLIFYDFHAKWCKNCQRIKPLLSELSSTYKVEAYSVDIDNAGEVAMEYDVSTLPRLLFFQNGKKIGDYLGSDEKAITNLFKEMSETSSR